MNESAMIATLARVEREQRTGGVGFDMDTWFGSQCSTACLAGHAALMEGWRQVNVIEVARDGEVRHVREVAAEILGFAESDHLFWLDDLDAVYAWVADEMGVEVEVLRDKVLSEAGA